MVGILITHGATHHPANWADHALNEFVPLPAGATPEQVTQVMRARDQLRGPVVDALAAVRDNEVKALGKITPGELEALDTALGHRHGWGKGHPHEGGKLDFLKMDEWTKKGLRSASAHADDHVQKIAKAAMACSGEKVGHNEMVEAIYRVLHNYAGSIQWAERSHRSTSAREN